MKKHIASLLLIALLCSCTDRKKTGATDGISVVNADTIAVPVKTVDVGRKDIPIYSECAGVKTDLSEIAGKVEFCALAGEPPLNYEMVADIALTQEDIFILLGIDAVYRFDKSGRFINRVGSQGQGPGEYVRPGSPLLLDNDRKLIYILDVARQKIGSFGFDGTFIRDYPAGNRISHLALLDSSTFIVRTNETERYRPHTPVVMFMDKKGQIIKKHPSHIYPIEQENTRDWHFGAEVNALWEYGGRYYSLEYGNDTIFRIEGTEIVPDRILSGKKYKPLQANLFHAGSGDKRIVAPLLMRPNSGIFESARFVLFRYYEDKGRYFLIYDKSDGQVYISRHADAPRQGKSNEILSSYFTDDLVSGLPFSPEYQSDGKLIGWLPAADIIRKRSEILQFIREHPSEESARFKDIVTNIKEEDNPVLMTVTLK